MKFHHAALGGTFDRFHAGHQVLLDTALRSAEKVSIGVTKKELTTQKILNNLIETYEERVKNIQNELKKTAAHKRATIVPLNSLYGPTLDDSTIDVLVVSTQTRSGADLINQERAARGLNILPIVEASMVYDQKGDYLSSTEIRNGQVSRSGKVYKTLFEHDIIFDQKTLATLKKPQGIVVNPGTLTKEKVSSYSSVTLVGDMVTHYFLDNQLPFNAAIIDGITQNQQSITIPQDTQVINLKNQRGTINATLSQMLISELTTKDNKKRIFKIEGEEDLLAFVPALISPLNSLVIYGQPNEGIVMIQVDEVTKTKLSEILENI